MPASVRLIGGSCGAVNRVSLGSASGSPSSFRVGRGILSANLRASPDSTIDKAIPRLFNGRAVSCSHISTLRSHSVHFIPLDGLQPGGMFRNCPIP